MRQSPRVRAFGDHAWLVDNVEADLPGLAVALQDALPRATVVAGLDSILVEFPGGAGMPALAQFVVTVDRRAVGGPEEAQASPANHLIPVRYDGADRDELAAMLGLTTPALVAAHQQATWVVAAVGFSPGFAYLRCDDPLWEQVGRRASPRRAVPAGAVAVAAGMSGIYPSSSPGGWQLIGTTDTVLFDADRTPPALLAVGDTVRFRAVTESEPSPRSPFREDAQDVVAGREPRVDVAGQEPRSSQGMTPSSCDRQEARQLAGPKVVIDHVAGVALLQDRGRAHLVPAGVPRSGPVDAVAHVAALGLVGNGAERPTIEFVGRLQFHLSGPSGEHGVFAACGDISVAIDGIAQPAWTCLSLPVGGIVELVSNSGFGYLALAGGPVVPKILGSAATCLLGGIGPAPLVAGQVLTLVGPGPAALACVGSFARQPQQQGPVRFIAGPHGRPPAMTVIVSAVDRIGVRVTPMGRADAGASAQLPSLAVVPGAIQMLPTGEQVILGPDSGTMGGYPVVGVLAAADLWRLGRVSVGDQLRLAEVAPDATRLAPYPVIVRPIA